MVAEVAMVTVFPHVSGVGIEKRVVSAAVRELDTGVGALRHDGLRLKNRFQCEHRQKQSDEREDRLCVKVNAHGSASSGPLIAKRPRFSSYEANRTESLQCPAFRAESGLPNGKLTAGGHLTEFADVRRVRPLATAALAVNGEWCISDVTKEEYETI